MWVNRAFASTGGWGKEKLVVRVAVLGLSDFGYPLALKLHEIGNEVIAVDRNREPVQRIKDYVTKAVVADVTDRAALEELGIGHVDVVLVSIGRRLESLVLVTHYLKQAGVPRIVVKVADEEQGKILALVGATDVVQPDRDIAAKEAALLTFPKLVDYAILSRQFRIVALTALDPWVGRTLADFNRLKRSQLHVIAVDPAGDDTPPIVPGPDYRIAEGDILVILGALHDLLRELRE